MLMLLNTTNKTACIYNALCQAIMDTTESKFLTVTYQVGLEEISFLIILKHALNSKQKCINRAPLGYPLRSQGHV